MHIKTLLFCWDNFLLIFTAMPAKKFPVLVSPQIPCILRVMFPSLRLLENDLIWLFILCPKHVWVSHFIYSRGPCSHASSSPFSPADGAAVPHDSVSCWVGERQIEDYHSWQKEASRESWIILHPASCRLRLVHHRCTTPECRVSFCRPDSICSAIVHSECIKTGSSYHLGRIIKNAACVCCINVFDTYKNQHNFSLGLVMNKGQQK